MTGVIYGSSMGNTEEAANLIASALGIDEVLNVANVDAEKINSFDKLILGSSTWGSGDLQDDWDSFDFDKLELSGKTVALFGLGDSSSYSDTFCDGMGVLYEKIAAKGATIVGSVSAEDYTFDSSNSVKDGKFVGLALDADNESDLTNSRIDAWVKIIKPSFS